MSAENPFRDYVIYDHVERCPYLPQRNARMPLRMPVSDVSGEQCDQRLALGERRSGRFVYRTHCESCKACEPLRISVDDFQMNRSQRRALKKGQGLIDMEIVKPQVDEKRVDLFNRHRNIRGLAHDGSNIDEQGYRSFLADSCFQTFEMDYRLDGQLIGVAICDRGSSSLSAVYCFYDPDFSHLSIGTFSVLRQVQYCLEQKLAWLYLGFYVEDSPHMSYKQRYRPHQRLINGTWQTFD